MELKDKLFCGVFPCGILYCDKSKNENGDYAKVAFLPYSTLELTIYKPNSKLLPIIKEDIKQYKIGDNFKIDSCGHCITLGFALDNDLVK